MSDTIVRAAEFVKKYLLDSKNDSQDRPFEPSRSITLRLVDYRERRRSLKAFSTNGFYLYLPENEDSIQFCRAKYIYWDRSRTVQKTYLTAILSKIGMEVEYKDIFDHFEIDLSCIREWKWNTKVFRLAEILSFYQEFELDTGVSIPRPADKKRKNYNRTSPRNKKNKYSTVPFTLETPVTPPWNPMVPLLMETPVTPPWIDSRGTPVTPPWIEQESPIDLNQPSTQAPGSPPPNYQDAVLDSAIERVLERKAAQDAAPRRSLRLLFKTEPTPQDDTHAKPAEEQDGHNSYSPRSPDLSIREELERLQEKQYQSTLNPLQNFEYLIEKQRAIMQVIAALHAQST